jgi:hypothetical protein
MTGDLIRLTFSAFASAVLSKDRIVESLSAQKVSNPDFLLANSSMALSVRCFRTAADGGLR